MKRLLLLSLTLLITLPAFSQSPKYPYGSDGWWRNVSNQTITILSSPVPSVRTQALKNCIYYVTYHPDRITLEKAVKPIIKLHQRDSDPYVRKLAVAALEAIGDMSAKRYLAMAVSPDEARASHQLIVEVLDEFAERSSGPTL
ncbi:MAG TPA: hypothetical protein VFG50_01730 [Rhodothermales bacterium]|nr:hypothetical protein [Rhodothermales bacterium]